MKLYTFLELGGETAGFLVPIFQAHRNANQKAIQQVDEFNLVSSFEPVLLDDRLPNRFDFDLEVHVGEPALWAFRDASGGVHVGKIDKLQTAGLKLLKSGALTKTPMAAAEMAAFCQVEADFPDVMKSAMASLSKISKRGALTWRDTVVLLPLIKQDITKRAKLTPQTKNDIRDVIALTREGVTHIYTPPSLTQLISELPRWKQVAKLFGIHAFEIHELRPGPTSQTRAHSTWSVIGIGGIARFVITRAPFFGTPDSPRAPAAGAVADGTTKRNLDKKVNNFRLLVSIMASDVVHAHKLERAAIGEFSAGSLKHAINVRPIGYGTPKRDKASPKQLLAALPSYDFLWILANHRQRKTSSAAPSLSASNTASRFVRAAALGLTACLESEDGVRLLESTRGSRKFGLFGATRYSSSLHVRDLAKRVLYSMLCEDAHLHSAENFTLVVPNRDVYNDRFDLLFGEHRYIIDIIARPVSHYDVVGFATGVKLTSRTLNDFLDFCISLAAGYGWMLREYDLDNVLLENEGEAMWLWPTVSKSVASELCKRRAPQQGHLILTNWSIPLSMKETAAANEWGLLHYSEMENWMNKEYRMRRLRDD